MNDIKRIYEMIYPYGIYGGDPVLGCYAINRQLKELCRDDQRLVLILLYKSLLIPPPRHHPADFDGDEGMILPSRVRIIPETPTQDICYMIQEHIFNVCLSSNMSDQDRARVVMVFKGALNVVDQERFICQEIVQILLNSRYIIPEVVSIFSGNRFANTESLTPGGVLYYHWGPPEWDRIRLDNMLFNTDTPDSGLTIEEARERWARAKENAPGLFRKGYDSYPELMTAESISKLQYGENQVGFAPIHVDFILKVFRKIYNGEYPPWITWEEICG